MNPIELAGESLSPSQALSNASFNVIVGHGQP
jgi:hypothetical protein